MTVPLPGFDSHCHLTNQRFAADRSEVIARARAAGLAGLLTVGTGLDDGTAALALARQHPGFVHASVGLDPFSAHAAGAGFAVELATLGKSLRTGGFVALGEIGIECHHDLDPLPRQREHLEAQLDLALELRLPVIIHARNGKHGDAHAIALESIRARPALTGVIHSFDGDGDLARRWLDLGFHVSFNGIVTFKANARLRQAATVVPADRLLVETDAPYLTPEPWRGRRNEPAQVRQAITTVAEVRGERAEDLAAWSTRNARALFHLDRPA